LSGFRFCPVQAEGSAPLAEDLAFLVAVSGVVAEKTAAAKERYNRCSLLARSARDTWNSISGRQDPTLFAALEHQADAVPLVLDTLRRARQGAALSERAEQFAAECRLIPQAVAALAERDLPLFGKLVAKSQNLAEQQLHNQVPETSSLARLAVQQGAIAASAFGAGFGGAVWALVPATQSASIARNWLETYQQKFPQHREQAAVHAVAPGPAVTALPV
jgi:galactokinase